MHTPVINYLEEDSSSVNKLFYNYVFYKAWKMADIRNKKEGWTKLIWQGALFNLLIDTVDKIESTYW